VSQDLLDTVDSIIEREGKEAEAASKVFFLKMKVGVSAGHAWVTPCTPMLSRCASVKICVHMSHSSSLWLAAPG